MTRISFIIILMLYPIVTVMAQPDCIYTLSGNVADADTREPLGFATVQIKGLNRVVTADSNGKYVFTNLCSGEYVLMVVHYSCQPLQLKVKVQQNTVQNIVLPHRVNELAEVRIVEKFDAKNVSLRDELNQEVLRTKRGLSFAEQLCGTAGVSLLQTGSTIAKPIVNGLFGNRLPIVNNGVRLESQQWGNDHAPEIDPFTAHKMTVIKGAGALKYGSDALAGAIIAEAKPLPAHGQTGGELHTGYFHNNKLAFINAMIEQNIKALPALSWRMQLSTKTAGNVRTPDYYLWNTGQRELNGSFSLGYRKPNYTVESYSSLYTGRLGIFMGSQVGNITDLLEAINRKEPLFNKDEFSYSIDRPYQQLMHFTQKVKYSYYKDTRHILHTQLSYQQNQRQEFDLARISDKPELNLTLRTLQGDAWYEHKHENWMHTYGTVFQLQENVWDGTRFFVPNYRSVNSAGYYIARYHLHKNDFEVGLRYDYRNLTAYRNINNIRSTDKREWNNISSTINYQRKITDEISYALNAGIAWRPPSINELYVNGLHHGTSSFEIGDPRLKSEVGYKTGVRFIATLFDSLLHADVYVYNQYFSGFINLIPDTSATLTIRGAYPTFRYVQTNANISGLDAQFTFRLTHRVNLQSKYSQLWGFDISEKTWLAQMPGNRWMNDVNIRIGNVSFFEQIQFTSGLNSVFQQTRLPNNNTDYALPPPTYHLVNVNVSTQVKSFFIQAGVNNLFNSRYRDYLNRFRYFNDEPGINFFIKIQYAF